MGRYLSCNADSAVATCDTRNFPPKRSPPPTPEIRRFSFADIHSATNGFSRDTFLGKGSHGSVYRAIFDSGNLTAAVKRTSATSDGAENELEILTRVRSPRLVNLIGHCLDGKGKKMIVVEYMPNGSLYEFIHVRDKPLGWGRRVRFAVQVARAVQHLHSSNPPVIHRDIKSSNVLIDGDFNARLSDFGLALRGHVEDVRAKCTPPAGTLGYLDPGYLAPGDLSTKSDVFSFGILLLEIISGRNAIDMKYSPPSVVDWAGPLIRAGDYEEICDPRIALPEDEVAVRQLAVLAARCVRPSAEKRPTMSEVVDCLKAVYKRVKSPILNKLGRSMGQCMKVSSQSIKYELLDDSTEIIKSSCRRNRNLSSISIIESDREDASSSGSDHVGRSKSVGSALEINFEPLDHHHLGGGTRRVGLAVKMPTVRLNKSRSTGMLQSSSRPVENNGFVVHILRKSNVGESEESKLLINLNERGLQNRERCQG